MPRSYSTGRYPHGDLAGFPKHPGTRFRPYDPKDGSWPGHECWAPWENPDAAEFLEIVW
jgi:hypothetical protein